MVDKDKPKNPHAAALGRLGGKAGTGDAKRRDPEFMKEIGRKIVLARQRKKREAEKAKKKGNGRTQALTDLQT